MYYHMNGGNTYEGCCSKKQPADVGTAEACVSHQKRGAHRMNRAAGKDPRRFFVQIKN